MDMIFNVKDSKILRPPIDEAYETGKVEGEIKGKVEGLAFALSSILRTKFGPRVTYELLDGLSGKTEIELVAMLEKANAGLSLDEVLDPETVVVTDTTPKR